MLVFASETTFYRRTGFGLLLALFSLFIFELPPLQEGVWLQTEQIVDVTFIGAAAAALWCLWGIGRGMLRLTPCHPVWFCMALWTGWQVVATALAPAPWRSWFGPPETGEGAGWYLALFLFMVTVSAFWQAGPACRRIMIYTAAANILVQCALDAASPLSSTGRYIPGSWHLGQWSAYLAFMAGYVWIAWAMAARTRTMKDYAAMTAFMVLVLWLSHNVSAMVLLGVAMLASLKVVVLSRFRWARRLLYPGRGWRAAAMAACALPVLWVLFSACFPQLEPYTRTLGPLAILSDKDGSLGSRVSLNQMSVAALSHEPRRWFIGKGWGGFSDVTFAYALVDGVTVYKNGIHRPNSLMVAGYSFHSHNQALEALLALGLPGLLLWLAIPVVIIHGLPRRYFWSGAPMLVGLVCLSGLWFELVECLPYKALALAALAGAGRQRSRFRLKGVQAALVLAALAMAGSAWQQKEALNYGVQLRDAAHSLPYADYPQAWVESDISRGGDRLRDSVLFYTGWLALKAPRFGIDHNDLGWLDKFLQAAHSASQSPAVGPYMASLEIRLAYQLLAEIQDPSLEPLRQQLTQQLPVMVEQLAARAPLRDDLAAPFLINLPEMTHHDAKQQEEILRDILVIAPDHRGALWVLGGLLAGQPGHEAEGQAMRRRAVALGVKRVYPLSAEELAAFK